MALAIGGIGGGVLGCGTGFLAARMMRWAGDVGLWLMITVTLVTGTYRIAGILGVSGPTAVVACGLMLRSLTPRDAVKGPLIDQMTTFWSVLEDLLNAMLFMLIGFELLAINFAREGLAARDQRAAAGPAVASGQHHAAVAGAACRPAASVARHGNADLGRAAWRCVHRTRAYLAGRIPTEKLCWLFVTLSSCSRCCCRR